MRTRTATNRTKVCCATITPYSVLPHRRGAVELKNFDYESLTGYRLPCGIEPHESYPGVQPGLACLSTLPLP